MRITIGGVQLCVSQTAVSNTTGLVCVPPVVVAPATPIAASTSAVTGSGVSAVIAAGSSLKVNAGAEGHARERAHGGEEPRGGVVHRESDVRDVA